MGLAKAEMPSPNGEGISAFKEADDLAMLFAGNLAQCR